MITTVNTKGQVTIPEPLRTKYGFTPGTKVAWLERDGEITPHPVLPVGDLCGYLKPAPGHRSLIPMYLDEKRSDRDREDV